MKEAVYGFYRGDMFITAGTLKEISKEIGLKVSTLKWYQTPSARKRGKLVTIFKLGEDDNAE